MRDQNKEVFFGVWKDTFNQNRGKKKLKRCEEKKQQLWRLAKVVYFRTNPDFRPKVSAFLESRDLILT